ESNPAVAYHRLRADFETTTGLEVGLAHHNSEDEGSRYDGVSGPYWWIGGMYQLTPAGERMKDRVEQQSWVTLC
ncbi:MAG: hypothetical protein V3V85_00535, partial [Candidatus Thorarchaeota archaeon]